MNQPAYDEVTAWLRLAHRIDFSPAFGGPASWQCSCGARNGPGTRLTDAQAKANIDRHLRAQRNRYMDGLNA